MELLVSLTTLNGEFTSPLFKKSSSIRMIVSMEKRVQELRDSHNACGLTLPMAKWLDAVRLTGASAIGPERFDDLMREFCMQIQDGNTRGIIWDRLGECLELTMVFTNTPIFHGIKTVTLAELTAMTKELTLSEAWQD